MKLCVPTMDDAGLAARISAHFGSAPYFAVVDTGSDAVELVSNTHAHHEHGSCDPLSLLSNRRVDAVVCHGLGRRALARLDASGIPVFVTDGLDVAEAVAGFGSGRLQRLTFDAACHGGRGHASE
ncbi:MAG TPA: NifB/NifX family molybdenum-iron cluster-binding protein [Gemmatimonadaceae bacterium]